MILTGRDIGRLRSPWYFIHRTRLGSEISEVIRIVGVGMSRKNTVEIRNRIRSQALRRTTRIHRRLQESSTPLKEEARRQQDQDEMRSHESTRCSKRLSKCSRKLSLPSKTRDGHPPWGDFAILHHHHRRRPDTSFDMQILFQDLGLQGILLLLTPLVVVVLVIFHHDTDSPAPPR
jgi:hypothetical protein